MNNIIPTITRLCAAFVGILWAYIEPNIPFLVLALFAMLVDCFTAYRLNCRLKKKFPTAGADGKLKSSHLSKLVSDMCVVFLAIIFSHVVERICFPHISPLYLPNYVCAIYCLVQFVSVLENESSCNGSKWAQVLQRVLANKVSRHIDISEEELTSLLHGEKKES